MDEVGTPSRLRKDVSSRSNGKNLKHPQTIYAPRPERRNPRFGVKASHGAYQVLEIIINTIPKHERFPGIDLVESITGHFKNPSPWVVAKMLQESIQPFQICEIGYLPLDHHGKTFNAFSN